MITGTDCPVNRLPIADAIEVLEGRWKLLILFALANGPKRFGQLAREIKGISDKSLSKDLKSLEANGIIERTVIESFPPAVEYAITVHGQSLQDVLNELHRWGIAHRKRMLHP